MPGVRVCLALGLACLRAAAGVDDESCLVQSQRDVVSRREAALKPDLPALPDLHQGLSTVQRFAKQLPLPGGVAGMVGNFSMTDLMNYGMEFLELMKDPKIVDIMYESLDNMSVGLLGTSAHLLADAKKLTEALEKASNESEVLEAVRDFVASEEKQLAAVLANVSLDSGKFWNAVPSNNSLKVMMEPIFAMTANATKKEMSEMILSFVGPMVEGRLEDRTAFCTGCAPLLARVATASEYLKEHGSGMVDSAKAMLPQVVPMIQGFAPDVAPTVMKLMNRSMGLMGDVIASAQESLPAVSDALNAASQSGLHCAVASEQSGAPLLRARFGLATALAAAMAWTLAA